MENNDELQEQLVTVEEVEEDPKQALHRQTMEMLEKAKIDFPDIPETLLYTAVLDYILHPDKTQEDFENDAEAVARAEEMKAQADAVPSVFYGVKVLDANDNEVVNNILPEVKDAQAVQG